MRRFFIILALLIILCLPSYILFSLYKITKIDGELEIGEKIPEFSVIDLKGEEINSESYLGQNFLLIFFTPKCPNCRWVIDDLKEISEFKEIRVFLISRDTQERTLKFIEKEKVNFPIFFDKKNILRKKFKSLIVPSLFLINREGILVYKSYGYINKEKLKEVLSFN